MAGETIRTEAVCLAIAPWSRTSHVVTWLTPRGKVATVVRGAERAKSFFLGQYDLNYTCDILYYAHGRNDVHALREAAPLALREGLRGDYRALALAGYCRRLVGELAPPGREAEAWYALLTRTLDRLSSPRETRRGDVTELVAFDLSALDLAGLKPDFSLPDAEAAWGAFGVEEGSFGSHGRGRQIRVSRDVAEFLSNPRFIATKENTPLDAARVISVFYQFHLDCAFDARRAVLRLIS